MSRTKIKDCIAINCISFTFLSVILSLIGFAPKMMTEMTNIFILELFCCTTVISAGEYFLSMIPLDSVIAALLLRYVFIDGVIILFGGIIFRWFPLKTVYIAEVSIISAAALIVTYAVMLIKNKQLEKKINERLKERKNDGGES